MRNFLLILLFSGALFAQNNKDTTTIATKEIKHILSIDSIPSYKKKSIIAHKKGEFETLRSYCEAILQIAEKNNLEDLKVQSIINLGIYYSNVGELDQAINSYLKAFDILETLPENKNAKLTLLVNLGNLYSKSKKYDKTIKIMEEVLEISKTVTDSEHHEMAAYNALGLAKAGKKEYAKAIAYNNTVKALAVEFNKKEIINNANLNLGENYLQLQKYEEAIHHCNLVLNNLTSEDSKEQKANALLLQGNILLAKKEYALALPPLEEATNIALAGNFFKIKMDGYKSLAKTYELTGNLKKSLQEQKKYTLAKEEYLNTLSKAQKIELEAASQEKTELLSQQTKKLELQTRKKQLYLLLGLALLLILIISFIIYTKNNNKLLSKSLKLAADKEVLVNKNEALLDKLRNIVIENEEQSSTKKNTSSYQKSSLTPDEQRNYVAQILEFMDRKKPYLNPEIKQSDIANKLSLTVHLFSEILNVCFQQNFNSFINLYRVAEAKSLMKNPEYINYKILSIGYEAGFSSKTSFNRAFKNIVGCTPSEYQKKQLSFSKT